MHLMAGRTSLVITHRLNIIREADQVLVINHGQVIEQGMHQQLLDQRGFYYQLYMSQFKGFALYVQPFGRARVSIMGFHPLLRQ